MTGEKSSVKSVVVSSRTTATALPATAFFLATS